MSRVPYCQRSIGRDSGPQSTKRASHSTTRDTPRVALPRRVARLTRTFLHRQNATASGGSTQSPQSTKPLSPGSMQTTGRGAPWTVRATNCTTWPALDNTV